MPWSMIMDHPECTGEEGSVGVVKDSDGSLVACHMSAEAAQRQIDALYANEGDKMLNKTRSAEFKALIGEGHAEGSFSAVVAVYGNVDKVGDRIQEKAFDNSLNAWRKSGDPIPIVLAHEWQDPFAHIGYAMPDKVKSVPGVGLIVEEGHLDIHDNPTAAQVYRLMKRRSLKEFSFGYLIPDGGQKKAMDGAFDLSEINLVEFGPCLKGVNDQTQLLAVKSALTGKEISLEDRVSALEILVKSIVPEESELEDAGVIEEIPSMDEEEEIEEAGDAKSLDGVDLERQIASVVMDTAFSFMENDMSVKDALSKSSNADEFVKQFDDLEDSLK